jgi:aminomethyltransferase
VGRVSAEVTSTLRRTPLHDAHVRAGAKLVPFAGWEMPIQYSGIRDEHVAVRTSVGIFDVSHMGQVQTRGPQAPELLQRLVSNDIRKVPEGGAQYGLLLNETGGVIDDLFTYRLSGAEFLTVTNAANHEKDLAWMQAHGQDHDADLIDRRDDFAMLAVQGPEARRLVTSLSDGPLPSRFHCCQRSVAGVAALICGTGYTGEDGVELLLAPDDAVTVWDAVTAAGATPAGLGARDTLRLEACFHLYGNDLGEDRDPIGAGLGWACVEDTGFIGFEAVAAARGNGPSQRLVPFVIDGPGIARQSNPVLLPSRGQQPVGEVTSGSFSPSLGIGIGMAYLPADEAQVGTRFQIDVRGTIRDAIVGRKPLYRKDQ